MIFSEEKKRCGEVRAVENAFLVDGERRIRITYVRAVVCLDIGHQARPPARS